MIPGINPNQPGIPNPQPGRVLGVNGTGSCVERIDPNNLCGCDDRFVAASSCDDNPGTLEDKLTSTDGSVLIDVIN